MTALGICVLMPVSIVAIVIRMKINETNKRAEIMLTAIEKGSNIDTGKLLKSFESSGKSAKTSRAALKEKLMKKLLTAFILMGIGITFCVYTALLGYWGGGNTNEITAMAFTGAIFVLIGAAFLISYFISRKFLAEELGLTDKKTECEDPETADYEQQTNDIEPGADEK